MVSFAPTSRETVEDQLLYTRARLTEVACLAAEPGGRHVYASCSRLRSSIDRAVAEGAIEIGAEDGY
jgi:hypothetical protein